MMVAAEGPSVVIGVATHRRPLGLERLLVGLDALTFGAHPPKSITVVVVDNDPDGSGRAVAEGWAAPAGVDLTYAVEARRGIATARNTSMALAVPGSDAVVLIDDDEVPEPGWLAALEDALDAEPHAAAAGSVLLRADGSVQSAGVRLTRDGHGADLTGVAPAPPGSRAVEVFGFCGGAVLVRTAELRACGGVPAHFFCYYEDTDTAWRLRLAGRAVVVVPEARVRHRHGASTRPGSVAFHRWNERNRLLALLRPELPRRTSRRLRPARRGRPDPGRTLRAALRNGLTVDEIREVILQSAIYSGVPAANSAFRIANEVLG